MAADAVGGILLAGVTLYAVLGGADFGGGLWDLLAGGDRRGQEPRRLIDESITPVWEANHVWLVFDLVIFWTAFPQAFAAVMNTVALPLWLAVAGIVLRGSGFAFRKELSRPSLQRATGATFAFSSLVTPFFMGTVIGAIATGSIPAGASPRQPGRLDQPHGTAGRVPVRRRLRLPRRRLPDRRGRTPRRRALQAYFTRRAQAAGVVAGALSLATLIELHSSNPALDARLTGRALALVVLAGVCGLAVLALLTAGRPKGARLIAALGVAAVVWGWGVAQYPVLLPGTAVTLSNAGAPQSTMVAVIVVFIARRATHRALLRPAVQPAGPPPAARGRGRDAGGRQPGRPDRAAICTAGAAATRRPEPRHPGRRARSGGPGCPRPAPPAALTGLPATSARPAGNNPPSRWDSAAEPLASAMTIAALFAAHRASLLERIGVLADRPAG